MKKIAFVFVLVSMIWVSGMPKVESAGCSNWMYLGGGETYCSHKKCWNGKPKHMQKIYKYRNCVSNSGKRYQDFSTEYSYLGCC